MPNPSFSTLFPVVQPFADWVSLSPQFYSSIHELLLLMSGQCSIPGPPYPCPVCLRPYVIRQYSYKCSNCRYNLVQMFKLQVQPGTNVQIAGTTWYKCSNCRYNQVQMFKLQVQPGTNVQTWAHHKCSGLATPRFITTCGLLRGNPQPPFFITHLDFSTYGWSIFPFVPTLSLIPPSHDWESTTAPTPPF